LNIHIALLVHSIFVLRDGESFSLISIKSSVYELSSFDLLLLKYVVGYSDLIFVPLIIILMDPDVRGGVGEVCRNRRAARELAESSIF